MRTGKMISGMMDSESGDLVRIKYSFKKILTGSDLSRRKLPFFSAEARERGPVLFLTACCHGDEVGGIVIIQEIFRKIRKEGMLKKGSVYAFPLMNPIGFETASRHIPFSKEDLNRSFPGNSLGSLGERIAHIIFSTILDADPSLVIDLHNDWIRSIPYVLVEPRDVPEKGTAFRKSKQFAEKTGHPVVLDSEIVKGTLSLCLQERNIPAITMELGESYVINEKNIEYGVRSIENIMSVLGMIERNSPAFHFPLPGKAAGKLFHYSSKPFSSTSGIIRFLAKPGDLLKRKQSFAKIYNTFGKRKETMTVSKDCIVLGQADSSVAFPGMSVMAFGNIAEVE